MAIKYRSNEIMHGEDAPFYRSLFKAMGYADEELDHKPLIGIANSWSTACPGSFNLDKVNEFVKKGVYSAGGTAVEFGTIGCCDGVAQGHIGMNFILPSREIIANSVEIMVQAHRLDGIVLLCSCDKIVPGMLMAAARLDIPAIVCVGGPMLGGIVFDGRKSDLTSIDEAKGMVATGAISNDEYMMDKRVAGFYATAFITQCLSLSLLGKSLGMYVTSVLPSLNGTVIGLIAVTVFFVLNLGGVNIMADVQKLFTAILVIALLIFGFYGMTQVNPSVYDITQPGFFKNGYGGFVAAIAIYAYSTYGQYMVMNFSKDAARPTKDVPLAIIISTCIIFVVYVSVAIVDCGLLPIDQVANKPLTLAAKKLFGVLYPVFIIGGPVMALMTTMNSTYGSRANPILRAARDGWFPEFVGRTNSRNVPYVIMFAVYLVGILPLIFGLSIKEITSNLVLVGYLLRMLTAFSIFYMPTLMKSQWEQSFLHVPNSAFYIIMILTVLANVYMVYLSLRGLSFIVMIINIIFLAFCGIYAVLRYNTGKVHMDSVRKMV
ncbi:amino acid permease [Acidaminococcus intestini]|uniref:amino acid permease n=1 Tax=Acidaminococcus intestini TaxID=187327 RepID=UPI0022E42883|nr:amino acid permease [Acidaminococcus intestini]